MVIEVNKKYVATFIIVVLAIIVSTFGGYKYGYNIGHKEGFNKGKMEAILSYEKRKGKGDNFYSEEIEDKRVTGVDYIIYHSTPNCEAIKNGVTENRVFTDSLYRSNNSRFCSKCMDENLIEKCQDWLNPTQLSDLDL